MMTIWERIVQFFLVYDWTANGAGLLKVILILLLCRLVVALAQRLVDQTLANQEGKSKYFLEERKARTLGVLLKSLVRYTAYALAVMMILREVGINTSALLAGAGVLGLAVGFGAQHLVKDVITGFFILFEDQYSVGDYIVTPDAAGTVEEIGLRITKLRDLNGGLHIIPNSEIRTLTNFNRGYAQALVDVEVAYYEEIEKVVEILKELTGKLREDWAEIILKEPEVLGLTQLRQSGMTFRILVQTLPMEHWKVERELRKRIKDTFEQEGIEIPYPHQVILDKRDLSLLGRKGSGELEATAGTTDSGDEK